LIPPQGVKVPTNQFIFGIAESIFEKLEKLFLVGVLGFPC
jgi:hypothetical protein